MNKFRTILAYTYISHLKSKPFLIMTSMTLLLIITLTNLQNILQLFGDDEQQTKVAVIDESNTFFTPLQQLVSSGEEDIVLSLFIGSEEEAKQAIREGKYHVFLHLETDQEELPSATYYAMDISGNRLANMLQQYLSNLKTEMVSAEAGIEQNILQKMFSPVQMEKVALKDNAKTAEELNQARGLVYFMIFIIYFAVLIYGNMIASEVAIEKSSRVMEIIVSSVSPITQMFAKISGIALLGLTQFTIILITGYTSLRLNERQFMDGFFEYFGLTNIQISTLLFAVIFFLLGYLLYAMMAAMLGSLVSRIEDVQQVILPMVLIVVASFMVAMYGINDPTSSVVTVTSFIPFFAPILMFLRVGMLNVPAWEMILSIGLLISTIIIFAIIAAKVYKGGVLLYNRTSSIKDFKKALQLTKKE
ncbi:ABC transporter permease [Salirhabdus salicampi]|uniref:ABC transporter permease n=1 Tax=Salirhabdus salicampi TaxID=476102 RepID=UPI0020C4BD57|nr:ABC transporter permease [Salirhabdus salicampi]MCP8615492.1 ABC transporter permease [Salirhabdus salicampi]